jgi:hypothetical protein
MSKNMIFKFNTKTEVLFIILFLSSILNNPDCYAQSISSTELINNAKNYNGNTVVYKGEVIGDIMVRGENAWINVNDGTSAIGIWIKKELIKNILYTGNYKAKGDLVEITGKFNRSCVEHGGDLDIHAHYLIKISSGNVVSHTVNAKEINFALGLFLTIILACLLRVAIPFDLNQGYQKR